MSSDEPLAAQTQSDFSALPLGKTGEIITCMLLLVCHLILAREIRRRDILENPGVNIIVLWWRLIAV